MAFRVLVILAMVLSGVRPGALFAAAECVPASPASVCCCEGGCGGCGCCIEDPDPTDPSPENTPVSPPAAPRPVAVIPASVTAMAIGWWQPMKHSAGAAAVPLHRGVPVQAVLCIWRT